MLGEGHGYKGFNQISSFTFSFHEKNYQEIPMTIDGGNGKRSRSVHMNQVKDIIGLVSTIRK